MANKAPKINFNEFLEFFPEVDLPVTFSDETISIFSKENDALPGSAVEQFLLATDEQSDLDDLTEFVPCIKIKETHDFHALVFWKAGLMNYQFNLITFTKDGRQVIDRRVIAGTYYDGELLTRSVATMDQDWTIYVVSGQSDAEENASYEASSSKAFNLELLPDGKIVNEI